MEGPERPEVRDVHERLLAEVRARLDESRQQEDRLKDVLTRLLDLREAKVPG